MNWTVGRSKQKNTTHEEDDDDDDGGDQVSPLILPTSLNESIAAAVQQQTAESVHYPFPIQIPSTQTTGAVKCWYWKCLHTLLYNGPVQCRWKSSEVVKCWYNNSNAIARGRYHRNQSYALYVM